MLKEWVKNHRDISLDEFTQLLTALYKGASFEEKTMAGYLLEYFPLLRVKIDLKLLDKWLDNLHGWAEIDSTCQPNFPAEELLLRWNEWENFIENLSKDKNINKRRASLVILTGAVSHNNDKRLFDLAFKLIDRLKSEKEIPITKAISWLLRDLTYLHREELCEYLKINENTLPKIALRETRRKILTGRK